MRQALLTVWKYCFERQIPPVLVASSSSPDGRVVDRIFGSVLPQDRLVVHNPDECYQSIEQVRADAGFEFGVDACLEFLM